MKNLIKEMIIYAKKYNDYELANFTYKLMSEFAVTINCPSNWQDIAEEMAEEFNGDDWIMEFCKLYEFE